MGHGVKDGSELSLGGQCITRLTIVSGSMAWVWRLTATPDQILGQAAQLRVEEHACRNLPSSGIQVLPYLERVVELFSVTLNIRRRSAMALLITHDHAVSTEWDPDQFPPRLCCASRSALFMARMPREL